MIKVPAFACLAVAACASNQATQLAKQACVAGNLGPASDEGNVNAAEFEQRLAGWQKAGPLAQKAAAEDAKWDTLSIAITQQRDGFVEEEGAYLRVLEGMGTAGDRAIIDRVFAGARQRESNIRSECGRAGV